MINTKKRVGRKNTYTHKHTNIYLLYRDSMLVIVTCNVRDIFNYIEAQRRNSYLGSFEHSEYKFYAFTCDKYGHYYQFIRQSEII